VLSANDEGHALVEGFATGNDVMNTGDVGRTVANCFSVVFRGF